MGTATFCRCCLPEHVGGACLLGYGAQWLTEWYAYDHVIDQALGLADNERVAGYIYIGAAETQPPDGVRPKLEDVLSDWQLP